MRTYKFFTLAVIENMKDWINVISFVWSMV
ncbi:MAG: hypothetical protein ACJARX_002331 [Psychroserpens sp.]|jgi:hypothetical protein